MRSIEENIEQLKKAEKINYMDWRTDAIGCIKDLSDIKIPKDALQYLTQLQLLFRPGQIVHATYVLHSEYKKVHPIQPGIEIEPHWKKSGVDSAIDEVLNAFDDLNSLGGVNCVDERTRIVPIKTIGLDGISIEKIWDVLYELKGKRPAGYFGVVRAQFNSAQQINFQKMVSPEIGLATFGSYSKPL